MTQDLKNKLAELQLVAKDICYKIWQLSEDENLTSDERERLESHALDADQLAENLKTF